METDAWRTRVRLARLRTRTQLGGDWLGGHIQNIKAVLHSASVASALAGARLPDLRDLVGDRVAAPGSASATQAPQSPGDFLHAAARRSLQVTALYSQSKAGERDNRPALIEEYGALLAELPDATRQEFPQQQLETADGRARAVAQLATRWHNGEVVELDPERTTWVIVEKTLGSASAPAGFSPQWFCVAGGHPVGATLPVSQWQEFGHPRSQAALADIVDQIDELQGRLGNARTVDWHAYCPDWAAQRIRCVVPCANAAGYEWVRLGPVATLGELFMQLGKFFTAKHIYAFFRTLRVVAAKRAKRDELGEIEAQRAQAAHVGTEVQAASLPGGPAAKVRRVR